MNFRLNIRNVAACALLVGLILRAATPLGYMPASPGSGLLFELCPGQLPAGFMLPGQPEGHDHHHHSGDDDARSEPDTCQIGHILSSTAAVDDADSDVGALFEPPVIPTRRAIAARFATHFVHRPRGPPA